MGLATLLRRPADSTPAPREVVREVASTSWEVAMPRPGSDLAGMLRAGGGSNGLGMRTAGSTLEGLAIDYRDTYGFWPGFGSTHYSPYLTIPAAWRASVLLSDLFGQMPFSSYRDMPDGSQLKLANNSPLLEYPAGSTQSPVEVRAAWGMDYLWEGNAVAVITSRSPLGYPTSCLPVPASMVGVRYVKDGDGTGLPVGDVQYAVGSRVFTSSEIIHVKGPHGPGALRGMGVLETQLNALRLTGELDRQAGAIGGNGVPTGVLRTDNPEASPDDLKEAKKSWLEAQRTRTIAALGQNIHFEAVAWNPTEMQLIEARQYQLGQIELAFGLPVGWLGGAHSSKTYSNVEVDGVNLLKFSSLAGMLARFEATFTMLLPRGQCAKANRAVVLASDTLNRYKAHAIATGGAAWETQNEVRAVEGKPPIEGGDDLPVKAAPAVPPAGDTGANDGGGS